MLFLSVLFFEFCIFYIILLGHFLVTERRIFMFAITEALIKPLQDTISSGFDLLVPIGISVMGAFIGISLIKRLIFSFL